MSTSYLLFKALHIIFMVAWFAGLFYLPRIFVYHAMNKDPQTSATFKIMERKLLIMTHIGMALTMLAGILLLYVGAWTYFSKAPWLHAKLTLVFFLLIYHHFCAYFVKAFAEDRVTKSHRFFRLFNEIPSILLIIIVFLAVFKTIAF